MKLNRNMVLAFTVFAMQATNSMAQGLTDEAVDDLKAEIVRESLPNCISVENYFDQVYCAGKIDAMLDDVLNMAYLETRNALDSSEKNDLKLIQKRWIEARGLECARIENDSVIVDLGCSTQRTVESIWFLGNISSGSTFNLDISAYTSYVQSIER